MTTDVTDRLLNNLTVLIVDDNVEICKLIKSTLKDLGARDIVVVTSGEEASRLLGAPDKHGSFNLILCDWNMSGMSGLELLRQVRSSDTRMPFLMITGNADKESVVEAKKHGVTGYITKPFSPAELHKKISVVAQMLAKRREKALAN